MASHSLAIAKASLAASLMRPDPTAVPRTDIAHFLQLIETLLSQCTATNIQLCKEWLLKHTGPSATRAAAVGKYLVTLSVSPPALGKANSTTQSKASRASRRRHQISILYMLHDLLHHTKFHGAAGTATGVSNQAFETYVIQLVASAAAYDSKIHTRHFGKLQDLLTLWSEGSYYPPTLIATLKQTVQHASHVRGLRIEQTESLGDSAVAGNAGSVESRQDAPYIIPPSHGDVADPFYDLPAGNLMPRIVPNSTTPINPQAVKPLQLRAGPADEGLVHAVKHLLQEADSVYGARRPQSEIEVSDINELGQLVIRDNMLDESSVNEAYYGWSRAFCKRMKLQSRGKKIPGAPHHSRDPELGYQGSRRYSASDSSRSRSRSPLRSRSPTRGSKAGRMGRQPDHSGSRSRSLSGPQSLNEDRGPSTDLRAKSASSRSRSRSYSPPDVAMSQDDPAGKLQGLSSVPPGNGLPHSVPAPPTLLQRGFLGPGQIPIPPPPPPNYRGQWPPPPPPPPASAMSAQTFHMNAAFEPPIHPTSSVPTQPSPPPPPSLIGQTFLPEPAQALYGQATSQYTGQIRYNNTGNLIGPSNQPWQHPYSAMTSTRKGGRDH